MDKKDIQLLEKLFWTDNSESYNYRTFEEIETALEKRKTKYSEISVEREDLNFEACYETTSPLFFYDREQARKIFNNIGFLGLVLPSTLDYILTIGIYNANKSQDMETLKNALHAKNRLKYGSIITTTCSYNHSGQFEQVIDAFADCDIELVKKYLPEQFGLADKNSNNFLRTGSNLIMSMLYNNQNWLAESLVLAEKFCNQKSSSKNDVLVIEYLIALSEQDTERASILLQDIANVYKKTTWLFNFKNPFLKFFGVYIHGLYHVAHYVLPGDTFSKIKTPEHTVFWNEFDSFTKKSNFTKGRFTLNLSGHLKELDLFVE